jgi:predicted amidohydrolase YtcJ
VGNEVAVLKTADENTRRVDLAGKTLLPGFVDSHGHAYAIGLQATTANLLAPPDGEGQDIPALQSLLAAWAAANPDTIEQMGWIVGFGYDDSQLAEERHPTRQELDAVSSEHPLLIIHQSGHLGVANSRALELAGITAATENPPGGVFRREAGSSEPNGVLEESAFYQVLMDMAAGFDDQTNDRLVIAGTRLAASYGYTTVQEGRASRDALDAMERVAASDALAVDLVAYPDMLQIEEITPSKDYQQRFRVGGAKLTIDGSPQGKTALLSQPYFHPPHGQPDSYRGYGAIDEAAVLAAVDKAFANGWQLLCHANGDAAIDQFIAAVQAARSAHPAVDNRPVLIHGQTLRENQVDELKALGIFPSLFPMHTFYWGDWHRESVLGPERAEHISPTGWLLERDMMFGSHHDAPVALPNSMRVLSATVTRRSRSGDILGPEHRVPVAAALKALTLWPAWQHFEEDSKGSIEPGKLADFVVLSDNPLAVPENQLEDLIVEQTIKEDRVIYQR